jgi:hypothetical protein
MISQIKQGEQLGVRKGDIDPSEMNRKKIQSHVNNLNESYKDSGICRTYTITRKNKDGKHLLLDSTHGFYCLENEVDDNYELPCYMLDWIDPEDKTQVKTMIMKLNIDRKNWRIDDYIKSHSMDLGGVYSLMAQGLKDYKKRGLSSGVIVTCYDKESRNHKEVRSGDFVYDTPTMQPYTDKLLKTLADITTESNVGSKKQLPNNFNREIVQRVWETIDGWNYDYDRFIRLLDNIVIQIRISISNNNLPGNCDAVDDWYKNITKQS